MNDKQIKEASEQAIAKRANLFAAASAFEDHLSRRSKNTVIAYQNALGHFEDFLGFLGIRCDNMIDDPMQWRHITHGLVEGFRNWITQEGYAISSVNQFLTTIRTFARLATKAGVIPPEEYAMINLVKGYNDSEGQRIDESRDNTRVGAKKAEPVKLNMYQASQLKDQPNTPQGRRDALLMCLLLDHGLRVGEVAQLRVRDIDLSDWQMTTRREKVHLTQVLTVSRDTRKAITNCLRHHELSDVSSDFLLFGSRKGGRLTIPGMSTRSITKRVKYLGRKLGIVQLSSHDCRHFWASYWGKKVGNGLDPFTFREAGGWSNLQTAMGYVHLGRVANDGMDDPEY